METIGAVRSLEIQATESIPQMSGPGLAPARDRATQTKNRSSEESKAKAAEVDEKVQEKIRRIAQAMDEFVRSSQTSLRIQVHPGTGNFTVKVISEEDGRTIREIPPDEALSLAARMEEMLGLLYDKKV